MTHGELQVDLAKWRRSYFVETVLGWWSSGECRADVVEVKFSYSKFRVWIFEVKATRADFLSDIRSGKWKKYENHSHRIYFATNPGVAKKEEIPKGVGLVVRGEKGWTFKKHATSRVRDLPNQTLLALLFYRVRNPYLGVNFFGRVKLSERLGDDSFELEADQVINYYHAGTERLTRIGGFISKCIGYWKKNHGGALPPRD